MVVAIELAGNSISLPLGGQQPGAWRSRDRGFDMAASDAFLLYPFLQRNISQYVLHMICAACDVCGF